MLRHGELSHGGTSSEGRAFECAQGQSGPNYDIKYDAINLQAPDERMVTVDDATIGPSSNGSMAQHYDTKYNTITLDTPDERKVLVNEATIGLGDGGSEIKYDTLTLDTPAENEVLVNEATIGHGSDSSSGDGLCSGSPKARARAGMRRRKMANRSTTQKLRDEAVNLCHVMIACTLMVGSWAKELMEDPLWEAWAVLQPRHHMRRCEGGADCLEIFAGEARISGAYARHRRAVLQPRISFSQAKKNMNDHDTQ